MEFIGVLLFVLVVFLALRLGTAPATSRRKRVDDGGSSFASTSGDSSGIGQHRNQTGDTDRGGDGWSGGDGGDGGSGGGD